MELSKIKATLKEKNQKMGSLKVLGRWGKLIRGLLQRDAKKNTSAEEKIHRMIVLGRWRILARRAVRR